MNTHEGVSCDQCVKSNFAGNRYKCLICYDFDLCHECYIKNTAAAAAAESVGNAKKPSTKQPPANSSSNNTAIPAAATSSTHLNTHPMQCILTKADYELHYGPGTVNDYLDQVSFTCPYCGKIGLSEVTLSDHINAAHMNNADNGQQLLLTEVVCPICAVLSSANGGDPNHLTDDLINHINLEHLEPFSLDVNNLREVGLVGNSAASAVAAAAALRFSRRLNNATSSSSAAAATQPGGRVVVNRPSSSRYQAFPGGSLSSFMRSTSSVFDAFGGPIGLGGVSGSSDPIAELLSQLAGVRRATAAAANAHTANLQHLQTQLSRESRDSLQNQSAAAVALAAAAATANSSGSGGVSAIHRHSNPLFSSANKLINKIGSLSGQVSRGGMAGSGASAAANASQQQQNSASASMSTNNLITGMLAQTLELPSNLFCQPMAAGTRDSRFLLTKYDFSNLEGQTQQSTTPYANKINLPTQSLFINDVLLSLLKNQFNETNQQQTLEGNESIIDDLLAEQQQQQQHQQTEISLIN